MEEPIRSQKKDVFDLTSSITEDWKNFVAAEVNDHVVRLSVLQREFHWYRHTKSDELFYVIEGKLFVDLEHGTEEIGPGQFIKIPRNMRHRTRAETRTLILCFESKDNDVAGD